MKVRELIEELQKHDPEMLVLVDGYEHGYREPDVETKRVVRLSEGEYSFWAGPWDDEDDWRDEYPEGGEPAVVVGR